MLGVLADVRFPMPAALAFLAVGVANQFCFGVSDVGDFNLLNINKLLEIL